MIPVESEMRYKVHCVKTSLLYTQTLCKEYPRIKRKRLVPHRLYTAALVDRHHLRLLRNISPQLTVRNGVREPSSTRIKVGKTFQVLEMAQKVMKSKVTSTTVLLKQIYRPEMR